MCRNGPSQSESGVQRLKPRRKTPAEDWRRERNCQLTVSVVVDRNLARGRGTGFQRFPLWPLAGLALSHHCIDLLDRLREPISVSHESVT